MAAFATGVAAAAGVAGWSPSTPIPHVRAGERAARRVPYRTPQSPSGRGAILWLGATPHLRFPADARRGVAALGRPAGEGPHALGPRGRRRAARDGDDHQRADRRGVRRGRARHAGRDVCRPRPARGVAARRLGSSSPPRTATSATPTSSAPPAPPARPLLQLREQRHYATRSRPGHVLLSGPADHGADGRHGLPCRFDRPCGRRRARSTHAGSPTRGIVHPLRTLGPAGYAPQLAAVLSDNNHAFVMWTDEPPPGTSATATIYLEHSGNEVTLGRRARSCRSPSRPSSG